MSYQAVRTHTRRRSVHSHGVRYLASAPASIALDCASV